MGTVTHPYEKIAADLRAAIEDGHLAPGAATPSANTLAADYGTTRNTARRAIELLHDEGLLDLQQGRRPHVRTAPVVRVWGNTEDWRRHRADGRPGFDATVAEHGLAPRQEVLDVQDGDLPPAHVAAKLGLGSEDPVVTRLVLQLADEIPTRLVRQWFPASWASGTALAGHRRIRGGVAGYIEDPAGPIGRRLADSRVIVGGRPPTRRERELLRLERGISVLDVTRVFLDGHGNPVYMEQEVADATRNRYEFQVTL